MEEEEVSAKVSRFFDGSPKGYISVGLLAVAAGFALGYFIGKKNEPTYHVIPPQKDFDYEEMEEFVAQKEKEVGIVSPDSGNIIEKGAEFVERTRRGTVVERVVEVDIEETVEEPIVKNVFSENLNDDWDYEKELKARTPREPYIVHRDEFFASEEPYEQYTQHTLTYYEGDNILCDEDNSPVYNHEAIVGPMKFGHGSGDPKVFYVRNEQRKAEYEVLHDPGLYSVEVLGLEIEDNDRVKGLKHSGDRVRKLRQE